MAVSSFTGRQDPFAEYEEEKTKRERGNIFEGVDLSGVGVTPPPQSAPDPVAQAPVTPDFSTLSVDAETDAQKVSRIQESLFEDEEASEFSKGVSAGTQQILGLYGAAKATFGSVIDDDQMVAEGIGYYQEKMREAEKFSPNVGTLEEIDFSDEGGFGRLTDYLGYTFGNVLPSMAITIGTGGVTGIAAGTAAKYLTKEGAQEALDYLAKQQVKDQSELSTLLKKIKLKRDDFDAEANERLQELIREDMQGALAKDAAARAKQDYINSQAFKYGLTGSGAQSVVLNVGENFGEIFERTGVEAPGTAIAAGLAAGALDTFATPLRVAKTLTPDMLDPLRDHLSKEALRLQDKIQTVLKEVGTTTGVEGMTEATQTIITELAVNFVNNNFTDEQRVAYLDAISSEEARSKILNSAAAGAIGGFGVSATTQAVAAGVDQIRGREPEVDIRQQLIDDRIARMDAIRDRVREVVEAEFTDIDAPALPAPEQTDRPADAPVTVQAEAPAQPPAPAPVQQAEDALDDTSRDTLETINLSAGITVQELAGSTGRTQEQEQQIVNRLFERGAIDIEVSGGTSLLRVTPQGEMDLFPPDFDEPELVDLPTVAEIQQEQQPVAAAPEPVTAIDRSADVPNQVMAVVETLDDFSIADVLRGTDLRFPQAKQALSQLETDGRVEVVAGGRYRVTRPEPQVQAVPDAPVQPDPDVEVEMTSEELASEGDTGRESQESQRQEPRLTPGPIADDDQVGRVQPVVGDTTQLDPIETDRVDPTIAPLTDENRVIEKPVVENTNELGADKKITYPESGNVYLVNRYARDAGGGYFAFPRDGTVDDAINVDSSEIEDVVTALRDVERQARATSQPVAPVSRRVTQPDADPKETRDPDFSFNGEYILTYPDGDVRRMYYDKQSRSWVNVETQFAEPNNPFSGNIGDNKKQALARLKEIRQEEFAQQTGASPRDDATIEVIQEPVFPGIPIGANTAAGTVSDSGSAISGRVTKINLAQDTQVQMGNTGDTFTQRRFGSVSLLVRNLEGAGSRGSPFVQPDDSDRRVVMNTILDEYREDIADGRLEDSPEVSMFANSLLDMVERGMPIDFVTNTNGIYINPYRESVLASFYPDSFAISVNPDVLSAAATDAVDRARLLHILTHEHWHLADALNNYSAVLPEFRMMQGVTTDAILNPDAVFALDVSDPVGQLYDEWSQGTELGREFHYPFANMGNSLADVAAESPDSTVAMENAIRVFEKEVFAQAGAVFIGNPDLLKNNAPEIYNVFRRIQAEPIKTAGQLIDDQNQRATEAQREPSGDQVPGDFRARTRNRSVQIPIPGRGRSDSDRSGGIRGAPQTLGDTTADQDGDASRRALRASPALDIKLEDLPSESQRLTATPILYGDQPPTPVAGTPTVAKVARELDNKAKDAYPNRDLSEQTDENAEIISDLIAHEAVQAIEREGNAGEWYQQKVANAMSLAAQRFPELDTDPNAKFAFTAIMAITSNGASVPENSINTFNIYSRYRESKIFPDFGVGKEGQSMKSSFMQLNDLISQNGIDATRAFMDQDVTVKELSDTFGLTVSGELMGTQLKGSAILGPKIGGGFYQNLNGNFDPLTMDRWFMRTYGRLTGSLMKEADRKKPIQLSKFRDVALGDEYRNKLRREKISRVRLKNDDDYAEAYARQVQRVYANDNFRNKTEINKASNTFVNSQGEKQAPQNGAEREYIRRVMTLALDKVNQSNPGNPINMGALQAIIWYPEKDLYKKYGVGNKRSEPTDYEAEFRKIIEGQESRPGVPGSGRSALEQRARGLQRTTGETDSDTEQVERTEVQEVDQEPLTPSPSLDMGGPGFRGATELLGTRNQLVADLERAGIPQGESVADISDADLQAMTPESRRLLKALKDDDWLGFDNIDDLLLTVFDEGLDAYETSLNTRIALGRYVNQNYGGVSSALDMVGDNPNKAPSNKFNEEDATNIVKDLQFRFEKILPFYRGLMDQYVDMKQLERKIAAARGIARLPADESFYDSENLMHGRAAYELDLVQKNYLEPIKDILSAKNLDVEALGKYLLAKHAPERNAVIAQKAVEKREKLVARAEAQENQRLIEFYEETPIPFQNFETEQGGSGISNAEAIEILALAERDGLTATMDEASQLIYDMLKEHRDRMVENQLLDAETVEDWEATYKFYVPLKGFAAEEQVSSEYTMSDKTRGFSITGSESLKAKGRTTLPANPVIISILDVAAKIKRGEKNKVSNVLLDMLENSGFETDPKITETDPTSPWNIWNNGFTPLDPATDLGTRIPMTQMSRQTDVDGNPKYIVVKRGSQTFFIEFKDKGINSNLQKLGEAPFNTANDFGRSFARRLGTFQNFRRNMLINYNPSWGLVNPIRDIVTAIGYSMSESGAPGSRTEGKDVTARMVYNYPNALRAYWRNLRETEGLGRAFTERGTRIQAEYDQFVKEYFEDGAPTGLVLTRTYEEEVAAIERDIKAGRLRKAFQTIGKFVEDFNQTMENAVRVSAYVEARKAGAPRSNAASLAKDLTVNFNRKGEGSAFINLGYLFFNAAQQGTQNFIQAIGRGGKKVPALLAGLFGAGYSITMYNILTSEMDDDDEVKYDDYNDSQLKRSINIAKEDGSMVALPLAYSYQFFYNAGRILAEYQKGLKDEGETFVQMMQSFIDNFSPVDTASGEGPEELRGFAPDILELWLDLTTNVDFFGNPIQREQFPTEPEKAQVYITKRSTSKMAKDIMQRLNDLDGSEYRNNEYIPYNYLTPDRIDYTTAWLLGGLGRFIGDASDVAYKAATDPESIELVDYPIVNQFYKEPSKYKDQSEFYANSDKLQSRLTELKTASEEERERLENDPELAPYYDPMLGNAFRAINSQLRVLRESEVFYEKELADPIKLRLELERIDADRQALFDDFNRQFRAAERKAAAAR